jgi:two-component system, OmpR family, manganese sensing response regulator
MPILLVDDEVELTQPLSRALRREGYEVEVAFDGAAAIQLIQQHQAQNNLYELLILDWMLPQHSGIEICQRLRSQGDNTPVLFLTARDTLDARVQGLDAGADDYLVKPFELRELLARVRALLRRNELLSQKMADTPLDPQRILVEGVEQHAQQMLTHEDIYQHLWPAEEKPNSNVLAAHIRLLRRKIEGVKEAPLIHTIYGKGYRFGSGL